MATEYHLWREYPTAPFQRFACTVVPDAEAEAGYRVVHHEPRNADVIFLHKLHDHMMKPALVHTSVTDDHGIADHHAWAHPGEDGHFEAAIRTMPKATLRSKGA